jgi:hypothetical protein
MRPSLFRHIFASDAAHSASIEAKMPKCGRKNRQGNIRHLFQCLAAQRSPFRRVGRQKVLKNTALWHRNRSLVMDRFALEHSLRNASARIVACQESLLLQRFQVRELERGGLDASVARALLEIYEESKAMAVCNRDSLASTLKMAAFATTPPADFPIDDASIDDHETFVDAEFPHRLAA